MNVSPPIAPKLALIPPSTASSSTNSSRRSSQMSSSSYDMEGADHFGFVPVGVLMQQRNADGGESIHHTPSPQTPPPPPPTSQPPSLSHTPPPAPLHAPPPPTLEQVSVAKLASAPSSNHPQPSTAPSLIPTSDILAAVGPKLTEWQSSAPQIQRNNQDALMAAMSTTKIRLYKALVTSIALYGCESWTLLAEIEQRIEAASGHERSMHLLLLHSCWPTL